MVTVSAIILTHNRKMLLKKAIDSVLSQSYDSIECIVVDDGSTDGTCEMMEALTHQLNLRYLRVAPEESRGGNYARNLGIKSAKGDFIAFLDDDDEWMPDKIKKQVALLAERPSCGVCYCAKLKEYNLGERIEAEPLEALADGDLSRAIFTRVIGVTSTLLVRSELLHAVGLFDESLQFWQEYELCLRLYQVTEVAVVREPLVLYRVLERDKHRLTNQIYGWEKTVTRINSQYAEQLATLSAAERKSREIFLCRDGLQRSKNSKNKRKILQYFLLRAVLYIKHLWGNPQ